MQSWVHNRLAWISYRAPSQEVGNDDYDFAEILASLKVVDVANGRWELLFNLLDIEPMELFFEDYIEDMDAWNAKILKTLELPSDALANIEIKLAAADVHHLDIQPQNTQLNETWEQRFHEDFAQNPSNFRPV